MNKQRPKCQKCGKAMERLYFGTYQGGGNKIKVTKRVQTGAYYCNEHDIVARTKKIGGKAEYLG